MAPFTRKQFIQTDLLFQIIKTSNESTTLALKARDPRRTPLDMGTPVLGPAPLCFP